uniref:interleukin-8-like n=1 Tax=Semicossyphus pulcher TaxID=241346 RepID=UPI0037E95D69
MKTAIFCIIFFTCGSVFSAPALLTCRCIATNKNVRIARIADVDVRNPRPYCNMVEVIVKLIDGTSLCLDPREKFTQAIIKIKKMQLLKNSAGLRTTTAPAAVEPPTL